MQGPAAAQSKSQARNKMSSTFREGLPGADGPGSMAECSFVSTGNLCPPFSGLNVLLRALLTTVLFYTAI